MNDLDLRKLVRQAVERHLGGDRQTARAEAPRAESHAPASRWQEHPSHHVYVTLVNTGDACVIEPAVRCDHCGYCKSHGH